MAAQEPFFGGIGWTEELGQKLQDEIDQIFPKVKEDDADLKGMEFSFTIADPNLEGCPLVGCSTGFKTLCGYEMDEIIGRNCRFLVDPVPKELVNEGVRRFSRDYCKAVLEGTEYKIDPQHREPWMPKPKPHDDGLFCVQTNARKSGDLFKNVFYMKKVELNDKPYIVGLQTELEGGNVAMIEACHKACKTLDDNMTSVERVLAHRFWLTTAMRRQDFLEDGFKPDGLGLGPTSMLTEEEQKLLNLDKSTVANPTPARPIPDQKAPQSSKKGCWGGCFTGKQQRRIRPSL